MLEAPRRENEAEEGSLRRRVGSIHVIAEDFDDVVAKLASNDPALKEVRCGHIEGCRDENKLKNLLEMATKSKHLTSLYAVLDDMTQDAWVGVGRLLNESESLRKLWIWALQSRDRPKTESVAKFFQTAKCTSIQGLGMEIMEPHRPFHSLEKRAIHDFFSSNFTMTIVNILCEARRLSTPRSRLQTKAMSVGTCSFLDCVLSGLSSNTTVKRLILRHSNSIPGDVCRLQVSSSSIRSFLSENRGVTALAVLVGSCVDVAKAISDGLATNCYGRHISLHHMNEQASRALLSGLGRARRVKSLHLIECQLASQPNLAALSSGLHHCCNELTALEIEDKSTGSFLNDLLQSLQSTLQQHRSLQQVKITCEAAILGDNGANAVRSILSNNRSLKRFAIVVQGVSDSVCLERQFLDVLELHTHDGSVARVAANGSLNNFGQVSHDNQAVVGGSTSTGHATQQPEQQLRPETKRLKQDNKAE